ncbi:MAG: hypothetical protein M3T96_02045 [Acidobacteriota bacterium]|nr:hypothetical protein [Acidobacteriota bacterium]
MKKFTGLAFILAMMFSVVFIAETSSANAQQTRVKRKRPVRGVVSGSKYVYRKSKNGVVYVYRKTAKGTVYVGRKTYQGGKYATKKTIKGTKYVGRKTVNGTKSIFSKTKKVIVN